MHDGRDRGRSGASTDRAVAGVVGALGVLTLGLGLHFLFVRPAMLPEDSRFTGVAPAELPARMSDWLRIVFRTWGGFLAGFGVVLVGVAAYLFTAPRVLLCWAAALGVFVAFGRFLFSNLTIRSDYLAFVAVLFGLAVVAAVGMIVSSRQRGRD